MQTKQHYFRIIGVVELPQISFSFDESSETAIYEITLRSSDGIISSHNQTTTSYKATNLIPGLLYDIIIISFDYGHASFPNLRRYATGEWRVTAMKICFCVLVKHFVAFFFDLIIILFNLNRGRAHLTRY